MATVNPAPQYNNGITKLLWEALATGDTVGAYKTKGAEGVIGSVQATGTFGGATITLTGSNDGTNFVALSDTQGTAIGLAAAGAAEFNTSMKYIKPGISGGTGDDVDVTIVLRT